MALLAVNRAKEAGESVMRMVDQGINMTEPVKTWVSGELIFYLRFSYVIVFYQTSKIVAAAN